MKVFVVKDVFFDRGHRDMLCVRACRGGEDVCGDKERRVERNEFHGIAFLGSFVFRRTANAHSNFAVTQE